MTRRYGQIDSPAVLSGVFRYFEIDRIRACVDQLRQSFAVTAVLRQAIRHLDGSEFFVAYHHRGEQVFAVIHFRRFVCRYVIRKFAAHDFVVLDHSDLRFIFGRKDIPRFRRVVPALHVAVDRLFVQNDIRAREVALYVHGFLGYGLVAIVWQLHRTVHIDRRLLENRSHNISVPGNRSRIQVEYRRFLSSDAASCFI